MIPIGQWHKEREKVLKIVREKIEETSPETFFMSDEEREIKRRATEGGGSTAESDAGGLFGGGGGLFGGEESPKETTSTPAPVPTMKTVQIQVPKKVKAGQTIRVEVEGKEIDVTIPKGVKAGQRMDIQVPLEAPPAEDQVSHQKWRC